MGAALKILPAFEPPRVVRPRTKKIRVADLFCGAGGFSTGLALAMAEIGWEIDLVAVNHWKLAVKTHTKNHPWARHYCQKVENLRPVEAVPDGRLDLLIAAPTCTFHSRARGGKPTSDQERQDPWHINAWLTELRVKRLLCENVPEFVKWGPIDPRTGRPIKSRRGEYFNAWIQSLRALGYRVEWRILNAANYGEATSRERFFMWATCDGQPIFWPESSHIPDVDNMLPGLFTSQRWRGAEEIIDWDIRGRSIFHRPKPLAAKTIQRIYAGVMRFEWGEPYVSMLRAHMDARGIPLPELPDVDKVRGKGGAFVLSQGAGGAPRSVEDPMPGMTCGGAHALVAPYYGSGSGKTCSSTRQPLPAVTTKDRFALIMPVTHGGKIDRATSTTAPLPTVTGANRGELAFITAQFGEREGQAPRVHPINKPMPTICADGHINLVHGVEHDILFRLFQPHELAGAMGFTSEEYSYAFEGNKTEVVKQIGNAVSVRTAKALIKAMFRG